MSGHSKWSNIKNKKGAADAKRGKIFSQISRQIRSAVREGGSGNPDFNASLRIAMEKAKAANMPKENTQRAIDRGLGKNSSGVSFQEIVYEGFGPGGIGLMIVAVTDNLNRTSSDIRSLLSKAGGSLGSPNSVSYMFERNQEGEYQITIPMQVEDEKQQQKLQDLMDALREHDDVEDVYCAGEWVGKE